MAGKNCAGGAASGNEVADGDGKVALVFGVGVVFREPVGKVVGEERHEFGREGEVVEGDGFEAGEADWVGGVGDVFGGTVVQGADFGVLVDGEELVLVAGAGTAYAPGNGAMRGKGIAKDVAGHCERWLMADG